MLETAKAKLADLKSNPAAILHIQAVTNRPLSLAAVFNTMRILKRINPGDTYYEQYIGMKERYGDDFFDMYQLLWAIGIFRAPRRILEIGTRTGISLCQLLSSYIDLKQIEKIVCVDPFDQWISANLVRANLKHLNLPHDPDSVQILAMRSEDFFHSATIENGVPPLEFDYILVDGDHAKPAAKQDLDSAHRLICKGGVIVFDDISTAPGECALIDVWEAWKSEHEEDYFFDQVMEGKGVAFAIRK